MLSRCSVFYNELASERKEKCSLLFTFEGIKIVFGSKVFSVIQGVTVCCIVAERKYYMYLHVFEYIHTDTANIVNRRNGRIFLNSTTRRKMIMNGRGSLVCIKEIYVRFDLSQLIASIQYIYCLPIRCGIYIKCIDHFDNSMALKAKKKN